MTEPAATAGQQPLSFHEVRAQEQAITRAQRDKLALPAEREQGLALSGGGIRSATFNLGVLQRLLEDGQLHQFDYLSTVSGGGYIGAWLLGMLKRVGSNGTLASDKVAASIWHLRRYSNYLTPDTSWLSLDAWAAAAIYLRNLALNSLLLLPMLCALLLLPYLLVCGSATPMLPSDRAWLVLACFGLAALCVGLGGPGTQFARLSKVSPGFLTSSVGWSMTMGLLLLANAFLQVGAQTPMSLYFAGAATMYALLCACTYAAWVVQTFGLPRRLDKPWMEAWRAAWQAHRERELLDSAIPKGGWGLPLHVLLTGISGGLGGVCFWWVRFKLVPALEQVLPTHPHLLAVLCVAPALLASAFATLSIHMALCRRLLTDLDREWGMRWMASAARSLFLCTVASVLLWLTPVLWAVLGKVAWALVITWLAGSGLTVRWAQSAQGGKEAGKGGDQGADKQAGWSALGRRAVLALGPYVFVLGVLMGVSLMDASMLGIQVTAPPGDVTSMSAFWTQVRALAIGTLPLWSMDAAQPAIVFLGLAAAVLLLGLVIDVNLFSFQSFYRNRLVRAYLGASLFVHVQKPGAASQDLSACWRWQGTGGRHPHTTTGLCTEDDIRLADLKDVRPYALINTAINLNACDELAWQDRKAASFTFSPGYCGFQLPPAHFDAMPWSEANRLGDIAGGYRPTSGYLYGDVGGPKLGLPVAISGAAFTSNAGYHTRPWMSFLLTLLAVRLGRWCTHPAGRRWQKPGPQHSLQVFFDELTGATSESKRYLYLSDGGHFENLGIYELVRRRCAHITVVDASADGRYEFEDLSRAIRLCRVDLGAEITFEPGALERLVPKEGGGADAAVARGAIAYSDGRTGTIDYIKPTLTPKVARDLHHYKATHADFPQESTLDQWFGEAQFESYRRLGYQLCTQYLDAWSLQSGANSKAA